MASPMVRYGHHASANCCTVSPASRAYTAAKIASPAPSASRCTPSTRPVSRSATIFATPRESRLTIARGTYASGSTRHSQTKPSSLASSSVMPTDAMAGDVNVTLGIVR